MAQQLQALKVAGCRIAKRAAVVRAIGEAPRCEKFAEPVPGDGEALVQVRAAPLKPIDKQLVSGAHFAASRELPFVCGTDGVGTLSDGLRVFFGGVRAPFGAMAERAVASRHFVSRCRTGWMT